MSQSDADQALLTETLRNAVVRFFYNLDTWNYDGILNLMTPDASWSRQGEVLVGHDQIRAALEARSPKQRIRHVITNTVADPVDDDHAQAVSYLTTYKHDDARDKVGAVVIPGPFRFLVIETRFVKMGGAWLICDQINVDQFHFPQ